jgi:FkbM family methyltransferase
VHQRIFKLAAQLEQWAARAQGKGSGAASIRHEVQLANSLLKSPAELAIDMGGNVGNYTAELRLRLPALEIHVFEPSPENAGRLQDRFSGDRRIHVVPSAVSDENSEAVLHSDSAGSGLASLARRRLDHFGISFDTQQPVQTLRFEDYWNDVLHRRTIDLVKLDIEGHEMVALKGCGAAIDHARVIQFEFGGCNIDSRTYFQDFWYFFKERAVQFRLSRMTPWGLQEIPCYSERDEFFCTTNYLAVNTTLTNA